MKDFQYAIFDMDGTLLESMSYWRNLGRDFLLANGYEAPKDLHQALVSLSTTQGAEYFIRELGVKKTAEEILREIHEMMVTAYREKVVCKRNVESYLKSLYEKGVHLCIATATPVFMAEPVLVRLGLRDYFEFVVDCETAGAGKKDPAIYDLALRRLGAGKEETVVFEDAAFAMRTAYEAGYYTIGLYDDYAGLPVEEIRKFCHEYWGTFPEKA